MDFDSTGDQILPSFYAEDTTNAMNAERRRDSLAKCLRVVKSDIDREKKVKHCDEAVDLILTPQSLTFPEGDGRRGEPGQGAAGDAQVRGRGQSERREGEVAAHAINAHVPRGMQVSENASIASILDSCSF